MNVIRKILDRHKEEEIVVLKKIVNEVFLADIDDKSRKRSSIDARKVYSKILRDNNYTLESIGESINKDHATILHYLRNIEDLFLYDKKFKVKYILCKSIFLDKTKSDIFSEFMNYVDKYQMDNGHLPTISEYTKAMIPLFDKK